MKRTVLLKAMDALNVAVAAKPVVEEMGCYRIKGNKMRTSDGRALVEVTLEDDTGLDCTVPAPSLYKLVSGLNTDDVELVLGNNKLSVKADKLRGNFALAAGPGSLDDLNFDVEDWVDCPMALKVGVRKVRFAASHDASRLVYCGVLVKGDTVLASDGIRIASFKCKEGPFLPDDTSVILTPDAAALLDKRASDIKQWAVKDNSVYFKTDNAVFGLRLQVGEYTEKVWAFIAKSDELDKKIILPDAAAAAIQRHLSQQDSLPDTDREIKVHINGVALVLSSTDTVRYELEETLIIADPVEDAFDFSVHPQCLLDALAANRTLRYGGMAFVAFCEDSEMADFRYLTTVERPKVKESK